MCRRRAARKCGPGAPPESATPARHLCCAPPGVLAGCQPVRVRADPCTCRGLRCRVSLALAKPSLWAVALARSDAFKCSSGRPTLYMTTRVQVGGERAWENFACVFLLPGEGAHSVDTDIAGLKLSPTWNDVSVSMIRLGLIEATAGLEEWLQDHLGVHSAPDSPVVTTVINILNADRWRTAGHRPCIALGHSIGEVAAAYVSGMLDVQGAIQTANVLGLLGCQRDGAMAHAQLNRSELDVWAEGELHIAAINGTTSRAEGPSRCSVTLSGPADKVDAWLTRHPDAKRMVPPHPWHHPTYLGVPGVSDCTAFAAIPVTASPQSCTFLSSVRATWATRLDGLYWRDWLTRPVNMAGALGQAAKMLVGREVYMIETGAHPVLTPVATVALANGGVKVRATASSMRRSEVDWFSSQLARVEAALRAALHEAPSMGNLANIIARVRCVVRFGSTLRSLASVILGHTPDRLPSAFTGTFALEHLSPETGKIPVVCLCMWLLQPTGSRELVPIQLDPQTDQPMNLLRAGTKRYRHFLELHICSHAFPTPVLPSSLPAQEDHRK